MIAPEEMTLCKMSIYKLTKEIPQSMGEEFSGDVYRGLLSNIVFRAELGLIDRATLMLTSVRDMRVKNKLNKIIYGLKWVDEMYKKQDITDDDLTHFSQFILRG